MLPNLHLTDDHHITSFFRAISQLIDAFYRWPDHLARRLAQRGGRPIGVTNNGLGGNRILHGG
jgi:hypothetical protein